jgi:hypothetical protein
MDYKTVKGIKKRIWELTTAGKNFREINEELGLRDISEVKKVIEQMIHEKGTIDSSEGFEPEE